jgi:hypothetical protein
MPTARARWEAMRMPCCKRWRVPSFDDGAWNACSNDNQRRLHDKLVRWRALSADDKKKDFDQVLLALGPGEVRQT